MRLRTAGVDEAGRGPLAGPVVAAAVILRPGRPIVGVADSKVLDADTRARLSLEIRRRALCFGIGWADPAEIDSLNILHATFLAMRRAVLSMACCPDLLLVDGNRLPNLGGLGGAVRARAIIGGDATEAAISAASILAKTARDHYMNQMHAIYPQYAFDSHKGYATARHRRQLAMHGPCPLHRRSFAPVGAMLSALDSSEDWEDEDLRATDPDLELDLALDSAPETESSET
jgi:ribonuclease HII